MNTAPRNARLVAFIGLGIGLTMALAANLTYAVPRGPVVVGLGVAAPLVLPLVIYLRSTFTVSGFWRTLCREAAMVAVAGPAVAISYVHTYSLVLAAEPHWPVLALIAPLSSDGVAGMSTMALHWAGRPVTRKPASQSIGHKRAAPKGNEPAAPAAAPSEIGKRHQQRAEMDAWISSRPTFPSIGEVQAQFQVSKSTAVRARNDARAAS